MRIHNRMVLKSRRKELGHNLTSAEAAFWTLISDGKLGKKFRRQHSVGRYVLDFYCPEDKLAIELDGAIHDTEQAAIYDQERTKYLNSFGIQVLRFEN